MLRRAWLPGKLSGCHVLPPAHPEQPSRDSARPRAPSCDRAAMAACPTFEPEA